MRILFIFPNWTKVFGTFSSVAKKTSGFPPLNLALLAAVAERDGHTVKIIDAEVEELSNENILEKIKEFSPDLIGLTSTSPMFHIVVDTARAIKQAFDIPIIVGGTHVTIMKEKAFEDCFDFLCVGESDETFPCFLKALEQKKDLSSVAGLIFRKNNNILFTGNPPPVTDLDKIPFPARHLLKMDRYITGTMRGRKIYTSVMFSRGCPFKCIYCSIKVFGDKIRRRSVKNFVDEIELVIKKFGITHFYFLDDTLTLDRRYTLDLCDEIDKRNLKITFDGNTRANLVDDELIGRLVRSGMIRIGFGLETADPKVLKIIRKGVPLESYITANKLTNKYKIETINSVMLGLPGETRESINKTISFLRRTKEIQHATYSIAMPYPGTEFYEMAKRGEYGLKLHTEDFSKYQRYESAVLSVNDITPQELIHLQKSGLLKIYLTPHRIIPMLRRFGIIPLLTPFLVALKDLARNIFYRNKNKSYTRSKP